MLIVFQCRIIQRYSLFCSHKQSVKKSEYFLAGHRHNQNMVEPIFDYQFRFILIGDSTVGKSSVLKYFTDGKFAEVTI